MLQYPGLVSFFGIWLCKGLSKQKYMQTLMKMAASPSERVPRSSGFRILKGDAFKRFRGNIRGLSRGWEGPGGGGQKKKKKEQHRHQTIISCFSFLFLFFHTHSPLGPPQPLEGLSLPSPINIICILKEQARKQPLLATK